MKALDNIKKNISPKARLMLGLTVLVIGASVTFAYMQVSSDGVRSTSGTAKLVAPPNSTQIKRDTPMDVVRFDESTEVGGLYKKAEEKKATKALESPNKSHVDMIRITEVNSGAKPVVEKVEEKPAVSTQSRLEALRKARDTSQVSKITPNNGEKTTRVQGSQKLVENPLKGLLAEEMRFVEAYREALADEKKRISTNLELPKASFEIESKVTEKADYSTQVGTREVSRKDAYLAGSTSYDNENVNQVKAVIPRSGKAKDTEVEDYDYPSERISAMTKKVATASGRILPGEYHYSILEIGINTDEISPIRALVVEKGSLEGAVLVGEPARIGEKAKAEFNIMNFKGNSYPVKAIALDPDNFRSGLADNVDRHTIERYTKLGVASFVEGFASALSGTQTITNTDGSSSAITESLPGTKEQALVGVGKMGERFSPLFEAGFNRPPTVTVEPNKPIIIMFMSGVDLDKPEI